MRRSKKLAAGIAAAMVVSAMSAPVSFAADNAFGIDEINWTDEDWASIAMTNDDTVDTGAVIRTETNSDSAAAGYLYRGAAVQVVDKGEEWTKVRSGCVNGYVKNEFLAFGDDARGLAAHYGKQGIVANWNEVNVYEDDHADAPVAAQLSDGSAMGMIEDNGHWIAVQHGADSAGFVSEEDVTRVLLVDTAVPAEGEDDEDVPVSMTAAEAHVLTASSGTDDEASSSEQASGSDQQAVEAAYASYTEDATYAVEAAYATYTDDTTYADAAYYTEDITYTDDTAYTEDTTYTDDTTYTEDVTYTDDTSYSEDTVYTDSTQDSGNDTLSAQTVTGDADVQTLYEAYIQAQNDAMNCTSEEDAQAKADAAIAAWNAYLTACGEAPVETSTAASVTTSETAEDTSYESVDTYSADEYVDESTQAVQAEETVQEETQAQESTSSSGGNAYGNYTDLDLLAAIIWCEAGNQSYDGMVAVGQVVMNRVASSSFPNTVSEVLNQPGQFTPASAGTLQATLASGVNSTCYAAAQDAMNGSAPVPGYPLYFNTHSGTYQLGAHYFS